VTEGQARALIADSEDEPAWPTQAGVATVIAEVDGGMVPLVEVDPEQADRRRGKRLRCNSASNAPAPGGRPIMPRPCSPCASPGQTASGRRTGKT